MNNSEIEHFFMNTTVTIFGNPSLREPQIVATLLYVNTSRQDPGLVMFNYRWVAGKQASWVSHHFSLPKVEFSS